jgi:hypothetical protein
MRWPPHFRAPEANRLTHWFGRGIRSHRRTTTAFGKEDWITDFDAELVEQAVRAGATEPFAAVADLSRGSLP